MKKQDKGAAVGADKKLKLLTGRDFWTSVHAPEFGIPSVRFSDGPHGLRTQRGAADNFGLSGAQPATCFPCLAAVGCSWDKSLARALGERLGEEARFFGVNVLLGPGVNIKRNPLCGRNFEYLSEDPLLAGGLAAEYIKGVQSKGVSACVKHFACNNRELARNVCSSEVSERALREIYLPAFEAAVKEGGVSAVMTAYNKLNGTYCSENPWLISGILRGEWGFDGIVVSDWTGTSDRAAGVAAGEDIEMPSCNFTPEELEAALESGKLTEDDVYACLDRLRRFGERYAYTAEEGYDEKEHLEFARAAAAECAVLLKNEGALPLERGESVALIGDLAAKPHIQGGGSAKVTASYIDDIIGCISDKFALCGFERGYDRSGKRSKKLVSRAVALAKKAKNTVLFMGLTDREDAEGADRDSMMLPVCQLELLERLAAEGVRPIVVLCCGSAVDMAWDALCSAVLYMPLTGAGTGTAVAELLCGEKNPCGKLAETFPVRYEDVPCAKLFSSDPYICRYEEDIFVGYRWYDAAGLDVKYPFGHGLSYTKFEYSRLSATERGVAFRIKNTGTRAGAEVVQLYICPPDCGFAYPVKKLAAYEKVFLGAGEERVVFIPLNRSALRVYDQSLGAYVVYGGQYGVQAGSSSRDIRLEDVITINGEMPENVGYGAIERENIIQRVRAAESEADSSVPAVKKGRVTITMKSPLIDLKRAKGLTGRLIYKIADLYCTSKKQTALLSFRYITVRAAMQVAGFNLARAHGFVDICNGKFFRGLKKIITGREKKN